MAYKTLFLLLMLLDISLTTAGAETDNKTDVSKVEEDCEDSYYGLDGTVDYKKAFQCYEKQQDWPILILMHLNGEGAPADVEKAEALLHAHQQDLSEDYITEVQKAIDARKKRRVPNILPCIFAMIWLLPRCRWINAEEWSCRGVGIGRFI